MKADMEGIRKCIFEREEPKQSKLFPGAPDTGLESLGKRTYRGMCGDTYAKLGVNHESLVPWLG